MSRVHVTVSSMLCEIAEKHSSAPWLCIPPAKGRAYFPEGLVVSYGEARAMIIALQNVYQDAGYGVGHRVALMLDSRPDHFLHMWALNGLGVSIVPLNADATISELAYVLGHAEVELVVTLASHKARLSAAIASLGRHPPVVAIGDATIEVPEPSRQVLEGRLGRDTEAAVIYTSGTTGQPKGCLIDNEYMFAVAEWYANTGGQLTLREGKERIYVPLPVFHVNAGINTPAALALTANCLVLPDRFHATRFWHDVVTTRATAMHYLGIIPPVLLNAEPCKDERQHTLRFGLGAGIDPQIHRKFEERFGFPMVEVWGMTETGRFFADAYEPRKIGTRAFGRPSRGLMARIVDDSDREMPRGVPGELVVRFDGADSRAGFFRGYLKDENATEEAWRGGHFHTGDVAVQDAEGMLYFVERRKNIIRRSGENIAATEVEDALLKCPRVRDAAVLPIADELHGEEVLACIVLQSDVAEDRDTAVALLSSMQGELAPHKWPGWMVFVADVPRTGTHKARKNLLFPGDRDPRSHPRAQDLRDLKRRQRAPEGFGCVPLGVVQPNGQ